MAERQKTDSPALVDKRAIASLLGVNVRTVAKFQDEGMPVALRGRGGRPSKYSATACRAWKDARDQATSGEHLDLLEQRAIKEMWQAKLAEQTFQTRARILIPADEVEKAWAGEAASIRSAILTSYTTHASHIFRAGTTDGLVGVERALKELAYDILRGLSEAKPPKKSKRGKAA